ncbi:hypothetical protein [Streptomyces sp. NPDC091217]|uniref:hypothetical protein n=1 Tax=Streptomyces sp. NPDC091217 TaxID=3365975 RepID=UPI0038207013
MGTGKVDVDEALAKLLQGEQAVPRVSGRRSAASLRQADTIRFVLFEACPAGLAFPQLLRAGELTPSPRNH